MYKYLGRQQNGHLVKGRVSSKSIFDALEQIKSKGISPIAIDRELRFLDLTVRSRATPSSDLIFFARQLSSFLKKSFSLSECLILISADMERSPLREALFNVAEDIERGESFNNALSKYPLVFPQVFTGIISASEKIGSLSTALDISAEFFEIEEKLHNKFKANILYPGSFLFLTIVVFLCIVSFMKFKIFPVFTWLINDIKGLNVPTSFNQTSFNPQILQVTLWVSAFFIGSIFICTIIHFLTRKKHLFQRIFSCLPPIGSIRNQAQILSFLRILGEMIKTNFPLDSAIENSSAVLDNKGKATADRAIQILKNGGTVSDAFESMKIFSDSELWFIKTGEKSGGIDWSITNLIRFRETDLEMRIGIFASIIQPLFIFVGGLYVWITCRVVFGSLIDVANSIIEGM
ncbi:MAG TPA: type II secretion system F family protein [Candidatus Ratteibacteria bacterium]|jgi:type IV pilus assembly protein PilC|nr:type II secretion system F family protein [bacterium]HON04963.1 type II secretion system F family protein [bacterium]HPC29304.1 type II secretion system F family protein [bacterium]HRS06041.1 type II secretion system F family protein [Candidatus Ratteibacteria bacterium]HRV03508.1 type II secretion system F family protein [Candidatus Ratteibacteria bacterium]